MREIKFRAWDDLNKKWLLGYEYSNLGGFSMMGEVMAFGEYNAMLDSFSIENWHYIKLMQYTGLKDENGKEIYEGDIYQVAGNKMYEVKYLEGGESNFEWYGGCFILYLNEELFFPFDKWAIENGKVIGNIYENPELIKQ